MSLIKKTLVLANKTPKGYATLVRVGNESGVKIVGEGFTREMKAYIKIGKEAQILPLSGKRTESELDIPLGHTDELSCVVFDAEIIAKGGRELPEKELRALTEAPAAAAVAETEPEPMPEENSERSAEPDEGVSAEDSPSEEPDAEAPEAQREITEEKKDDETEMLRKLEEKSGYYIGISDKIDELFVVYPSERLLENAIPDSQWVKVAYDGDDYYVVGKLSENGRVRYLGYGVPGRESVKPPKVADGISNWFPLEGAGEYDGYWLFFQDAETGKIEEHV